MPNFIHGKKDESRWAKAKKAVSHSKKKDEGSFGDRDYALANYIYHKMGKTEEDANLAELLRKSLMSMPVPVSKPKKEKTSIPNPKKVGLVSVRMPKAKKMATATDKPSKFFKGESVALTGLDKLKNFIDGRKK